MPDGPPIPRELTVVVIRTHTSGTMSQWKATTIQRIRSSIVAIEGIGTCTCAGASAGSVAGIMEFEHVRLANTTRNQTTITPHHRGAVF